ncbi:MAG: ABC transporter permease [Candidatus Sericytochromatia bacterium]|nr:ABC transporter permease [Candidatus Tanganyikabacteria bacterium]
MEFLVFLARRHLRTRWRQSAILVASIAVGVAILTTALSLTNGFEADLVGRILSTTPHIAATNALTGRLQEPERVAEEIRRYPAVTAVLPYVSAQGLIAHGASATGALIRGIDPALQGKARDWSRYVVSGDLASEEGLPGVMLGSELARKLGVSLGDRVKVVTGQNKQLTAAVTGLFAAGLYEYDSHIAFLELKTAQRLFGYGATVTGLDVRLNDVFRAPRLAYEMSAEIPANFRPWTLTNHSLRAALALEKRVIFLVTLFIIIVATMGVANTLAMWVLEQSRELGLLRAIGAPARLVGRLVVMQGFLVGCLGTGLGLAAGWLLSVGLAFFPLQLPQDVYYIDKLPVEMQAGDFLLVAVASIAISLVGCLLPARRALKLDPIEIVRRTS